MTEKSFTRLSLRLTGLLTCSIALAACQSTPASNSGQAVLSAQISVDQSEEQSSSEREAVNFTVEVIHPDGSKTEKTYTSSAQTLGDVLLEDGLIEGEESQYGLYVKTVDGITADFDSDGSWWKLLVNSEESPTGVSDCPIEEGAHYTWQYTR